MAHFDTQINEIKNKLDSVQNVLVVLPKEVSMDKLAAGLALYLSLKASGKNANIVSEALPLVSHSNLFGIGEIKNSLPKGSGNFMVHLDGVADPGANDPTKKVPTLEKLDWYTSDSTLNLVFHVVPGQRFEPTNIRSSYENGGLELVFVIGAASVAELGELYIQNLGSFSQAKIINIDINPANTNFGAVNLVGTTSATLSEVVSQVLNGVGLKTDPDIATNILTGIYEATNNLSGVVDAETFLAVSLAMQAGGNLPGQTPSSAVQPIGDKQLTDSVISNPAQTNVTVEYGQPAQQQQETFSQSQTAESQQAPSQSQANPVSAILNKPQSSTSQNVAADPLFSNPFLMPQEPMITFNPIPSQTVPAVGFTHTPTEPIQNSEKQPVPASEPVQQVSQPQITISDTQSSGFDLSQVFQIPQMPSSQQPSAANIQLPESQSATDNREPKATIEPGKVEDSKQTIVSSPEERPMGEYAQSPSPEMDTPPTPEWLVPKIFKGGNLG